MKEDPSRATRGTDWKRETGGKRGGWEKVQRERTRAEPGWDHGDGEEKMASEKSGIRRDRAGD